MIGVFVKFRYGEDFEEETVRNVAASARTMFEGMPGLHSKAFTFNSAAREATNFYVWESERAARAFLSDATVGRIADVYGVRPAIEFVQVAELVENGRTWPPL